MIVDLQDAPSNPFSDQVFDVCICGAGVAGITLALHLSRTLRFALLEGGGLDYSEDSQSLYEGQSIGQEYFDLTATRLRYFGGTSNHWAGWCVPLDAHDFERKPYAHLSGWPISRTDLDPYLEAANAILDLDAGFDEASSDSPDDIGNAIRPEHGLRRVGYRWSPPTRFAEKYGAEIRASRNIFCFLNANLIDLTLDDGLTRLQKAEIRDQSGRAFSVRARLFVLAAGGLETPRILLNCNRQIEKGIGNGHDLVGRYFAEHPNKIVGEFILEDGPRAFLTRNWGERERQRNRHFAPTVSAMAEQEILNYGIFCEFERPHGPTGTFKERLKEAVWATPWIERTLETLQGEPLSCPCDGTLRVVAEQELNPQSRVLLDRATDRFGLRRITLDWQTSALDRRTIRQAAVSLAGLFATLDVGRVRLQDWLFDDTAPFPSNDGLAVNHHMCTTRMAATPREGVVDSNQKVFDTDNLYIAGSSVFSTPGHDSPTISIVQTTLRLADHLNRVLAS